MLVDNDEIIELIKNGHESEFLDFKVEQYTKEKHEDLLKDIMAMANSKHAGNKYIIIGVNDLPKENRRDIVGIVDFIDSSNYHQLVFNNIEPEINFNYFPFNYEDKLLGIFIIHQNYDRPYILKKNYSNLKNGLCWIRKGSQQSSATRSDFDNFYRSKKIIPKFKVPNSGKRTYSLTDNSLLNESDGILLRNIGETAAFDVYVYIFLDVFITYQEFFASGDVPTMGEISLSNLDMVINEWKNKISKIKNDKYAGFISHSFNILVEYYDEYSIKYSQFIEGAISWTTYSHQFEFEIGNNSNSNTYIPIRIFEDVSFEKETNELVSTWKKMIEKEEIESINEIDEDARGLAKKIYKSGSENAFYKVNELFKYCEEAQCIGRGLSASLEVKFFLENKPKKIVRKDEYSNKLNESLVEAANASSRHYFNSPDLENYFWDLWRKYDVLFK